jgi:hypothetical protein
MPDADGGLGNEMARRMVAQQDQLALREIVEQNDVCEATGQWLKAEGAVAMTVSPGVSRLAG